MVECCRLYVHRKLYLHIQRNVALEMLAGSAAHLWNSSMESHKIWSKRSVFTAFRVPYCLFPLLADIIPLFPMCHVLKPTVNIKKQTMIHMWSVSFPQGTYFNKENSWVKVNFSGWEEFQMTLGPFQSSEITAI